MCPNWDRTPKWCSCPALELPKLPLVDFFFTSFWGGGEANRGCWCCSKKTCRCGSKLSRRGYAGFGPCFHFPGFHLGTGFLSHSHVSPFFGPPMHTPGTSNGEPRPIQLRGPMENNQIWGPKTIHRPLGLVGAKEEPKSILGRPLKTTARSWALADLFPRSPSSALLPFLGRGFPY